MPTYKPSLQNNLGFLNTLHSLNPTSPAETVSQIWTEIITEWFPGRHGHKWSFQNTTTDSSVIQVTALQQNPQDSNDWVERRSWLLSASDRLATLPRVGMRACFRVSSPES
ncbi:hypothetical protein BO94DRAFT_534427 [Aspergillus sclerotioniger CBS 115572]|uniref:Uncharacterized protein n=1 Tax=Aspergillus sclerotioniger CBS 115572 TaxID=1450535 RepID=A0A317WTE5_9EURO|nr:hypothetical protein BO94DRAFT_534427 [Aspergillus sclerotioniger CBS 115572]PWY89674.1 hypothetical protein BO94DRAFT_534427 [Aspergillus sclerotioniger CBS 115572]